MIAASTYTPPDGPWYSRDPATFQTLRHATAETRFSNTECIRYEDLKSGGPIGFFDSAHAVASYFETPEPMGGIAGSSAEANIGYLRAGGQIYRSEPVSYPSPGLIGDFFSQSAFIDLLQVDAAVERGFFNARVRLVGSLVNQPQASYILSEPGGAGGAYSRDVYSFFSIAAGSDIGFASTTMANYLYSNGFGGYVDLDDDGFFNEWFIVKESARVTELYSSRGIDGQTTQDFDILVRNIDQTGSISTYYLDKIVEISIPFSSESTISMLQWLSCAAGDGASIPALGPFGNTACRFDKSVYWLGGTLTDWDGNIISGSIRSASGFDYLQPSPFIPLPPDGVIPEPATWAMLIAGFGLVGGILRRRRELAA